MNEATKDSNEELTRRLHEALPHLWVDAWLCADGGLLISLDGEFTVEELETVIAIVREWNETEEKQP